MDKILIYFPLVMSLGTLAYTIIVKFNHISHNRDKILENKNDLENYIKKTDASLSKLWKKVNNTAEAVNYIKGKMNGHQ